MINSVSRKWLFDKHIENGKHVDALFIAFLPDEFFKELDKQLTVSFKLGQSYAREHIEQ